MKTKTQWVFFLLTFIFAGTVLSSKASDEKQHRKVSNFEGIHVSSGIDLYLTMGNDEDVTIVADDDLIDDIITEVRDGILNIYLKDRIFRWKWNNERKAYVTVKTLKELHASAGSDVVSENTITGGKLEIKVSSGSDLKMDVEVEELSLKSSSGSDARLSGRAKNFDADASSGSDIRARDLRTKNCKVEVSSGSDATVSVENEIVARASSGGDVTYYGDPKYKDTHESSGGDVRKR